MYLCITSDFSRYQPVVKDGVPDYPEDDSRWESYLAEMSYYIRHGYKDITGRYFFHLNFATIEGLDDRGYPIDNYPYHVDVMKDVFDLIDYSEERKENVFVWKARDKAFSYNMSSLCVKETMFETNNTILTMFPKGEEVYHKDQFRSKYIKTWNGLPQCFKRYPYLKATQDIFKYGWVEKDPETGQEVIRGSNNLITFQKVTNKDIGKSFRAKFIIIDEAGEIDCLKALVDTSEANMMKGGQKYGTIIMGGTSNANNAGYDDVCFIWQNAEKLKFNKFFIPRAKGLWGWVPTFDDKGKETGKALAIDHETGESKIDIAEGYFTHREKELESINDVKGLMEFKQNYPKDENDAFLRLTTSPYPVLELQHQKQFILSNEPLQKAITRGNMVLVSGGDTPVVDFKPDPYGRWYMYLPPNKTLSRKDVIGVDTVRATGTNGDVVSSNSKNAMVVYRPFQSMKELSALPVCIYWHRHPLLTQFYSDLILTCIYYDSMALIEDIGQEFSQFIIENGGGRYMARRPSILTELGSNAQNRWGWKPNSPVARDASLNFSVEETKANYANHVFVQLLDNLINFGDSKYDLEAAYRAAILLAKENIKIQRVVDAKAKRKIAPRVERYLSNQKDARGNFKIITNEPTQPVRLMKLG